MHVARPRRACTLYVSLCTPTETLSPQPRQAADTRTCSVLGGFLAGRHAGAVDDFVDDDRHAERLLGARCRNTQQRLTVRARHKQTMAHSGNVSDAALPHKLPDTELRVAAVSPVSPN